MVKISQEDFNLKDLIEGYSKRVEYYIQNPMEITRDRARLSRLYISTRELKNSLPEKNNDYFKLGEFEKTIKSLLMKDLTKKLKQETGN